MNKRSMLRVVRLIAVFVVPLLLVILLSMALDEIRQPPPVSANPECPHMYDTVLALPADVTSIPEYHDCQKLINLDDEHMDLWRVSSFGRISTAFSYPRCWSRGRHAFRRLASNHSGR